MANWGFLSVKSHLKTLYRKVKNHSRMSFYGSPISLENNIIKFSEMDLADSGTNRRVRNGHFLKN
jgi:hypothetical protein